jgi:hypothetical protein
MGESPAVRESRAAREAIQNAANEAYERQKELVKDVSEKAATYETKAKEAIPVLSAMAGRTPTEYVTGTREDYKNYLADLTKKYEPALLNFRPGLIGSESAEGLNKSLLQSAGAFTQGVSDVGRKTSADLYRTLLAGPQIARSLAESSATNLALDPEIMRLATNPPIKTELNPGKLGYSQYMQYNV